MVTPPTIEMANLGMADSLILMVMALVVFGPRRLPQIGRQIGKLMYEFRKASNDFKFQMEEELRNAEEADRRKKEEERQRALAASVTEQASVSADPPTVAVVNAIEMPTASPDVAEGESTLPGPSVNEPVAPAAEETTPRIMPPSAGETVSRPFRQAGLFESPSGDAGEDSSEPSAAAESKNPEQSFEAPKQAQAEQKDAATEALNQHG
jgi:sec-independent protein translocase protein TatB